MMPATTQALLDMVMPKLVSDYANLPAHALRDTVALVFAPGLTEEMDQNQPTALLVSRATARQGLVLACQEDRNMAPLTTFDGNHTDGGQLVVVVFDHGATGTIVMRHRAATLHLDLN